MGPGPLGGKWGAREWKFSFLNHFLPRMPTGPVLSGLCTDSFITIVISEVVSTHISTNCSLNINILASWSSCLVYASTVNPVPVKNTFLLIIILIFDNKWANFVCIDSAHTHIFFLDFSYSTLLNSSNCPRYRSLNFYPAD